DSAGWLECRLDARTAVHGNTPGIRRGGRHRVCRLVVARRLWSGPAPSRGGTRWAQRAGTPPGGGKRKSFAMIAGGGRFGVRRLDAALDPLDAWIASAVEPLGMSPDIQTSKAASSRRTPKRQGYLLIEAGGEREGQGPPPGGC